MPKLSADEKRKSAGLAAKLAGVLSSDMAKLAGQIDPTKINMIVTNAFDILQGMGLASATVAEALSKAGRETTAKGNLPQVGDKVWYGGQQYTVTKTDLKHSDGPGVELKDKKGSILTTVPGLDPRWGAKPGKKLKSLLDVMWSETQEASVNRTQQLQKYLRAHPGRKQVVIATLIRAGKPKLATAVSKMVIAKKAHFNLSQHAEQYENEIATNAGSNYGAWKDTAEAEKHVKKAVRDHAKRLYNDVMESFGKEDIKYIVEMHMYQDDEDPYNLDPPDPKVGKILQKVLEKTVGKDWKKVSGYATAEDNGMSREAGDPKAWIVWIEGSGTHSVDTLWEPIVKAMKSAGYKEAKAEPYDNATIVVHPDSDY